MMLSSRELMPLVRTALERGQRVRLTVTGSSMLPFVRHGEVVELVPPSTLRLGDVVLVRTEPPGSGERYVLHRVVRFDRQGGLFIRGDAQAHCQGPFTRDAVLGRLSTAWHPGGARVVDRGWRRVAGLAWMRTRPASSLLLHLALTGWRLFRRAQQRLHHI